MGLLMIRCPETGRAVSTDITVSREAFAAMPVFFSRSFCPYCRTAHEWFAKDAWVAEAVTSSRGPGDQRGDRRVA
ncbi:hypothetical protein CCR97_15145 [Rhodoplanes elegans]|uniref:Uncharacterized protein n=1 Tax=Rhodoplanes elegans TaxID=29408 RepID=A0A327KCC6_9BRAD|nr:hypothetical protein [Rhodoplanes elegans]MBK5959531.1 hypothetical protein [Rhodoplanes elegans]RAI36440.1 hypothetical protein CH338_17580 [Rhodoplanes elegans]